MSVCLSACLSVCLSVCLFLCLFLCLSICLRICLLVCLFICLRLCQVVCCLPISISECRDELQTIDVKKVFYDFIIFIKNAFFKVFLFLERFLFSSGEIFYPTKPAKILLNLLKFSIKRLLSDGFNMAVLKILS